MKKIPKGITLPFFNAKGFYFTKNGKWFLEVKFHLYGQRNKFAAVLKKTGPLFEIPFPM